MICPVIGSVIAVIGGMVISGSQITDAVLSKQRRSSAENIVKKYKSRDEFLIKKCFERGTLLQDYGDVDADFPSCVSFWRNIAGWNGIVGTILDSLRIVSYVDGVMSTGAAVTTTAFKAIGSTTGRAFHVAGGVFGILLLPINIHTLVAASIDVHKTNPHKTSETIREMAAKIKASCPPREYIEETVANLSHV